MEKFINFKIVEAEPMYRREAYEKGYHRIANGDDIHNQPNDYGYHIVYETGYHSWCPAKEFEQRNKPTNPLRETAILMNSDDYKERFVAEYKQLAIRYKALANMCIKWDNSQLEFKPDCPREMYDDQLLVMKQYLNILEERAKIENININN
mgnify:CR=1 FL=1